MCRFVQPSCLKFSLYLLKCLFGFFSLDFSVYCITFKNKKRFILFLFFPSQKHKVQTGMGRHFISTTKKGKYSDALGELCIQTVFAI